MQQDEPVVRYAEGASTAPSALLRRVEEVTRERTAAPIMMTGRLEAGLLAALAHATGARLVLEIGTFTGFGTLTMARQLAPGGRVVTCEVDEAVATLAREHFAASELGDRIDLRMGPALATIATLDGPFDLVYVDADKPAYRDYYEAVVPKLAPRGILVADNTLQGGRVLEPDAASDQVRTMAAFNAHVQADPRTECVLLPFGDGVTVAWRRAAATD